MGFSYENFVKERDDAFRRAVLFDDWDGVYRYLVKYQMLIPEDSRVLKGAIYKAVRECTLIDDDTKKLAAEKAKAMGFSPSMFEVRSESE